LDEDDVLDDEEEEDDADDDDDDDEDEDGVSFFSVLDLFFDVFDLSLSDTVALEALARRRFERRCLSASPTSSCSP
jgi:hypothetical protein